jgi:hypothetical protein
MPDHLRDRAMRRGWIRLLGAGCLGLFLGTPAALADPPAVVARLESFQGTVTFSPAGTDNWSWANLNRPLSDGDRLWIGAGSRAEAMAGPDALRLGANTGLRIAELRESATQLQLTRGEFEVRVRAPMQGRLFEVDTPNLAFQLRSAGDYRIDVDADRDLTTVTVRAGHGTVYGPQGEQVPVGANERMRFAGAAATPVAESFEPPLDGFDAWVVGLNRREDASVAARYVGVDMTGYQDLDRYGAWHVDPVYGPVWVPLAVAPGWAPYHDGHWAWIAPWGWTWIDNEPWGFAPFHYGRWAYVSASWVWVPGPMVVRPVYAPALVAFVGGGGGGVRWSVSLSSGSPGIAWFPLAPGEVYRPVYAASPAYVQAINRTVIVNRNVTVVNNTTIVNNVQRTVYVNQTVPGAVAAVPATAFVQGRSVQAAAVPFSPQRASATRVLFSPPVAPVARSVEGREVAVAPPQDAFARQVVATREPPPPAALHDQLALRFAEHKGIVPGAGRPLPAAAPLRGPAGNMTAERGAAAPPSRIVGRPEPVAAREVQGMHAEHAPVNPSLRAQSPEVPRPPDARGRERAARGEPVRHAEPIPWGKPLPHAALVSRAQPTPRAVGHAPHQPPRHAPQHKEQDRPEHPN